MKPPYPISGKIATRKCPTCGHHEVGYITADGSFYPLKTGETIEVLPEDSKLDFPKTAARTQPERPDQGPRDSEEIVAWIPDPVKQNRALRIKYGVFIRLFFCDSKTMIFLFPFYKTKFLMVLTPLTTRIGSTQTSEIFFVE